MTFFDHFFTSIWTFLSQLFVYSLSVYFKSYIIEAYSSSFFLKKKNSWHVFVPKDSKQMWLASLAKNLISNMKFSKSIYWGSSVPTTICTSYNVSSTKLVTWSLVSVPFSEAKVYLIQCVQATMSAPLNCYSFFSFF